MKYSLLGAVSTLALGAAFGMGTPGAANAALVCTGSATSGTCTETDHQTVTGADFTNVAIPVDYFANGATGVIPNPGVNLTSVSYNFGDTIHIVGTLTNSGSGTESGYFSVSKNNYTFAGGTPSSFLNPTVTGSAGTFKSKTVTLASNAKSGFTLNKPFNNSPAFTPSPAGYSNTGTFDAFVTTATTGGAQSTPANFTASEVTTETAYVTITYNYTTPPPPPPPPSPTPEPASLALLGAGLAGLGAIRRRRKG